MELILQENTVSVFHILFNVFAVYLQLFEKLFNFWVKIVLQLFFCHYFIMHFGSKACLT